MKDKFKDKLMRVPLKKDIRYDELKNFLKKLGYIEISRKGGYGRKFYNSEYEHLIALHEPHPKNTLKIYQIKYLQKELRKILD